ncbi:CsbD family protein [Actinokineospora sp. HUAS TT18]|uniref:CsbD family protein n=1 Tax=Actinokineospora sp. HUAS TT18 TaxID=3447451 RepID=UPI003F522901
MSVFDKAKDKAEQLIGDAKEKIGEMTGNESLANSGRADQVKGEVKEAGHDVRDKAEEALGKAKDKLD